jgi:hypothetical protein
MLKPVRRERGIPRGVLDVAMPQVGLQGTGVVAVIRQLVAAGMPQHVGVHLDAEISRGGGPFHHARETWRCQRRAALRYEHEGRVAGDGDEALATCGLLEIAPGNNMPPMLCQLALRSQKCSACFVEIETESKEDLAIQLTEGWIPGCSPTVRTQ